MCVVTSMIGTLRTMFPRWRASVKPHFAECLKGHSGDQKLALYIIEAYQTWETRSTTNSVSLLRCTDGKTPNGAPGPKKLLQLAL